jgi:hypothetical protein
MGNHGISHRTLRRERAAFLSRPPMKCRKRIDDVETGGPSLTREESGGCPDFGPDGIRHEGGMTQDLALARNVGTWRPDAKGEIQVGGPHEDESTEAGHRGGATRSRVESSVMEPDRRGCVVQLFSGANQQWEDPRG